MVIIFFVALIIIAAGLMLTKLEHHGRRIKLVAIVLIICLVYFSVSGLFHSGQLDLTSPSGIANSVYTYVGWISQTAVKLWGIGVETTGMVGNAIKLNNTETK